jgi:ABC-type polysaccharide/polyol phosphate export permease
MKKDFHLLTELIKRDFVARFTGSALGWVWAILQPAILIAVYWFVFTFMIPAASPGGGNSYIYFLIAGLVPWIAISEGLARSLTSIVDNAAMVRKLPLRSELLVMVPNASALIFEAVGLLLFLVALTVVRGFPSTAWLLVIALLMQFSLQMAVALFLAATYVFFRDVAQILGFVLSVVFYLSPILYSPGGRFGRVLAWNPLTPLIGLFRSAMLGAPLPEASSIVFLLVTTGAAVAASFVFFRRVQAVLVDLI